VILNFMEVVWRGEPVCRSSTRNGVVFMRWSRVSEGLFVVVVTCVLRGEVSVVGGDLVAATGQDDAERNPTW
jgi:hypothetical protein